MASPFPTPPATPSKRYGAIPEILAVHFEELASLWAIRQEHICGPDWNLDDLAAWDARLVAHVDALAAAGDEALPILEDLKICLLQISDEIPARIDHAH